MTIAEVFQCAEQVRMVLVRPELRRVKEIRIRQSEFRSHCFSRQAISVESEARCWMGENSDPGAWHLIEHLDLIPSSLRSYDDVSRTLKEIPIGKLPRIPHSIRAHFGKPRQHTVLQIPDSRNVRNVRRFVGVVTDEPEAIDPSPLGCARNPSRIFENSLQQW